MGATVPSTATLAATLRHKAAILRMESVRATSEAGSGHPSSCCSAADIVATLFFSVMRYDPKDPRLPGSDRFVLSKGHAAPLLYAAWAEAGLFDKADLLKLRTLTSDLEGHPTPRLSFAATATGSLGQGLSAGVGMAVAAKRLQRSAARVYVLMGDGESVEGSVWEAVEIARHERLDNLCAIVDVNRLGQSDPTMLQHDMEGYRARWAGFGWNAVVVDGHDVEALVSAFAAAAATTGRPTVLLARTFKGKGISFIEDRPDWHGKALKKGEELDRALAELAKGLDAGAPPPAIVRPSPPAGHPTPAKAVVPPSYKPADSVATREAFGHALAAIGEANPLVVGLDADVKNSTFTDAFGKRFPDRFLENYIAEQNMVGAAVGLAASGYIPFAATFACFLTRAYDFIRMAAISGANIKLVGTHAGVSIGEDGPSQMGLEDLAMMGAQPGTVVLYPADAYSAYRLVEAVTAHRGLAYIRTGRPKCPILYGPDERFPIGGSKVLRRSPEDRLTIVAAGVTVFEALKAHDQLKGVGVSVRVIDLYSIVPVDRATLLDAARATGGLIVSVEDHYAHGGVGDAVLGAVGSEGIRVHKLAVREVPHSGKPDELIDRYGISARAIVDAVKRLV
jgi:transketolase